MKDFFGKILVFIALCAASACFGAGEAPVAPAGGSAARASGEAPSASAPDFVLQTRLNSFDVKNYNAAVSAMFSAFEKNSGKSLKRGSKGRVGLKIYTNSGAGLATPKNLIDAVVRQLQRRGYAAEDITIVDMSARKMRACGLLPKLSEVQKGVKNAYGDVNVADVESGRFFDKRWYYDNPLTPKNVRTSRSYTEIYDPEVRKSYLPIPLFLTVDYWINLPVITDMEGLGVCAAIGNMSLWNMSNNERFLKEPANASMAAAEVSAIPELRESNAFTILSFEIGQFVGGAVFNARFSFSENVMFLSANPVVLDYIAWQTINKYRRANRFAPIDTEPPVLNYCKQLGVGDYDLRKIRKITVPYSVKR